MGDGAIGAGRAARHVALWAVTAALAGFLFGFDTAVIAGAEQAVQRVWSMSDWTHGLAISAALWGTVVGALFGGIPSDRFGRKPTLIVVGVLYAVSALGSALAWDPASFMLFRFMGGIGVGVSSIAAPAYIAEIAPAKRRGPAGRPVPGDDRDRHSRRLRLQLPDRRLGRA